MPHTERQASTLRAYVNRGRLVCNILGSGDGSRLRIFVYHNGMGLKELVVNDNTAVADVGGIAPGLLTVWLTDGGKKPVAQRVLWVGGLDDGEANVCIRTSGKPGDRIDVALPEDTSVVRNVFVRVVPEWEGRVPTAREMLYFRSELASDVPFPTASGGAQMRHDVEAWLMSARQTMIDSAFIAAASVRYAYAPEKQLTLSGRIMKGRKPLQDASVQVYSPVSGIGGILGTDSVGRFGTAVDDYLDGTKFFVQAYNQKGRPGEFEYEIDKPDFPPFVAAHGSALSQGLALQGRYVERVAAVDTSAIHSIGEVEVNRRARRRSTYKYVYTADGHTQGAVKLLCVCPSAVSWRVVISRTCCAVASCCRTACAAARTEPSCPWRTRVPSMCLCW